MANCPNKSSKEWIRLVEVQGLKMAHYLWDKHEGSVPESYYTSLNDQLINGFLKDFGIDAVEYQNIQKELNINAYTASDLVAKMIAYNKGESITSEVAYFAYKMLGKENDKLANDLRYAIRKWDKFKSRWRFHATSNSFRSGWIKDKNKWARTINDLVIVDFLKEHIEDYYFNRQEFVKRLDTKWTSEDFTIWEKIMRWIENFLSGYKIHFKTKKQAEQDLDDIGTSIANEILDRNYEYYNYKISEDAVRKYYKETVESDPRANQILTRAQALGLVSTGSLALRRAGTVYRTLEESIHDLDFVVPFDLSSPDGENIDPIYDVWSGQPPKDRNQVDKWLQQFNWYNQFKEVYPNYKLVSAFYGKEHKYDFESLTVIGVIDGEFYDSDGYHEEEVSFYRKDPVTKKSFNVKEKQRRKHNKGDYIKGTGYNIDFFVRLTPLQEEHENYFKLWKEIMIAKLKMGRAKDFADWRVFVPYTKSLDSYNFYYKEFAHFNYESSASNLMEDAFGEKKTVYQGVSGKVDNRMFNYYTTSQEEAMEYGSNVRAVEVNTAYFLQGYSPEYTNEFLEYRRLTGKSFDLLDNSKEGLENQKEFFRFLMNRGYKGIDFTNYSDSNYVIEFKPAEAAEEDIEDLDAWEGFGEWQEEIERNKTDESDNPFCL
jgi:hypothetical protein